MTDIRIEIKDQGIQKALRRLTDRAGDASPAMKQIAQVLENEAESAFGSDTSPDGVPWPDLSLTTIKIREKKGRWPGKKLQQTGGLASSIQQQWGKDYALVGTNKVYAAIQQLGAKKKQFGVAPWGDIPPRPFLGLSDSGRDEILDILSEWLDPQA